MVGDFLVELEYLVVQELEYRMDVFRLLGSECPVQREARVRDRRVVKDGLAWEERWRRGANLGKPGEGLAVGILM